MKRSLTHHTFPHVCSLKLETGEWSRLVKMKRHGSGLNQGPGKHQANRSLAVWLQTPMRKARLYIKRVEYKRAQHKHKFLQRIHEEKKKINTTKIQLLVSQLNTQTSLPLVLLATPYPCLQNSWYGSGLSRNQKVKKNRLQPAKQCKMSLAISVVTPIIGLRDWSRLLGWGRHRYCCSGLCVTLLWEGLLLKL